MNDGRTYSVLFLGNGNAARSIMAEAILKREGNGRFVAHSAGIQAHQAFDAHALDLLRKMRLELPAAVPRDWAEFSGPDAPRFDFIFTLCQSAKLLPHAMWNGNPLVADWSIPNPALADGNEAQIRLAYADAFRMISNRVMIFVSLPMDSLSAAAAQLRLNAIGQQADVAAA